MGEWYKAEIPLGHAGTGQCKLKIMHFYVNNPVEVLERYPLIPGSKGSLTSYTKNFPTVVPITSEEEAERLEIRIIREGKISLEQAKRTWHFD